MEGNSSKARLNSVKVLVEVTVDDTYFIFVSRRILTSATFLYDNSRIQQKVRRVTQSSRLADLHTNQAGKYERLAHADKSS